MWCVCMGDEGITVLRLFIIIVVLTIHGYRAWGFGVLSARQT